MDKAERIFKIQESVNKIKLNEFAPLIAAAAPIVAAVAPTLGRMAVGAAVNKGIQTLTQPKKKEPTQPESSMSEEVIPAVGTATNLVSKGVSSIKNSLFKRRQTPDLGSTVSSPVSENAIGPIVSAGVRYLGPIVADWAIRKGLQKAGDMAQNRSGRTRTTTTPMMGVGTVSHGVQNEHYENIRWNKIDESLKLFSKNSTKKNNIKKK